MFPTTHDIGRLRRIAELLDAAPFADPTADETSRELVRVILGYLVPRLEQPEAPVVIAVAGADGVGKSFLANAITGRRLSAEGAVRPTTTTPVLIGRADEGDGWQALERRLRGASPSIAVRRDTAVYVSGAVVVDLPATPGPAPGARLMALADLVLVVTTPTRYADAATWALIEKTAASGVPMRIVLNRAEGPADEVIADLRNHLVERELTFPVDTVTQGGADGVDALRRAVEEAAGSGRESLLDAGLRRRTGWVMRTAFELSGPLDSQELAASRLGAIADAEYQAAAEGVRALASAEGLGPGAADTPWDVLAERLAGVITRRIGLAASRTAAEWSRTVEGAALLADGGQSLWRHTGDATSIGRASLLEWDRDVTELVDDHLRRRRNPDKAEEVRRAVARVALGDPGKVRWRIRRRLRRPLAAVAAEAQEALASRAASLVLDDKQRFLERLGLRPDPAVVEELRRLTSIPDGALVGEGSGADDA